MVAPQSNVPLRSSPHLQRNNTPAQRREQPESIVAQVDEPGSGTARAVVLDDYADADSKTLRAAADPDGVRPVSPPPGMDGGNQTVGGIPRCGPLHGRASRFGTSRYGRRPGNPGGHRRG